MFLRPVTGVFSTSKMESAVRRLQQLQPLLYRCVQQSHRSYQAVKDAIQITPRVSLFDQQVHITLQGLPSQVKVTLQASTETEWRREQVQYVSCGHYITDTAGNVDLRKDASVGGTYTGVEPMGLFWSLQPSPSSPQNVRMVLKNVTVPVLYTLCLYLDHLTLNDLDEKSADHQPVSVVTVERQVMSPTLTRIPVREGRVRGTLFLPAGKGPFAGVIDMFGLAGGLIETRAALLAAHGYAVLALPIYRFDDLPSKLDQYSFEYFESAVHWLDSHPSVKSGSLGIVATSGGAGIGMLMAYHCPQVKAFVRINGSSYLCLVDMYYKGQLMQKGVRQDFSRAYKEDGALVIKDGWQPTEDLVPLWQKDVHVMALVSEDDKQSPNSSEYKHLLYPADRHHMLDIVRYPGAGHLLEPPFTPFCRACYNPYFDGVLHWGGNIKDHASAQEDSWQRIVKHFAKHLS